MLQYLLHITNTCFGLMTRTGVAVCDNIVTLLVKEKMNCVSNHAVHLPDTIHRNNMNSIWKMFSYVLMTILLITSINAQAVTPPGTAIDNVATATFQFTAATGSESVIRRQPFQRLFKRLLPFRCSSLIQREPVVLQHR